VQQVRGDLLHQEESEQRHHRHRYHQGRADHAQLERPAPASLEPLEQRSRPAAEPGAGRPGQPQRRQGALAADPAYLDAVRRQTRREQARALVINNPALAADLGIGRPDLDRDFDDGGLIDVNEVPAAVLATLPGFTSALADEVIRARDLVGGRFFAADDLVVHGGVPPEVLERVRDRLLIRPI